MLLIHNAECSSANRVTASSKINNLPGQKPASIPQPHCLCHSLLQEKAVCLCFAFFFSLLAHPVLKQILTQCFALPEAYSYSRMANAKEAGKQNIFPFKILW